MKDIFLVDADDTILDFHASSALSLRMAFEALGVAWETRFADVFKVVNDGLWTKLEERKLTRKELIDTRFSIYLKALGLELDADEFNQRYLHALSTHPIYVDGAEAFLKELNTLGRVYIVTNGTLRIQKSRFEISNLYSYARDVFVSDAIGYDKPSPKYTEYVLSHIEDFDKARAVWVGDSLNADIKCANEAGIDSVWFNPSGKARKGTETPTYEVKTFAEILKILKN